MDGMLGIGCAWGLWQGFAAHQVDKAKPFFSETGYRSFLGIHAEPVPGLTPEVFAQQTIQSDISHSYRSKTSSRPRRRGK